MRMERAKKGQKENKVQKLSLGSFPCQSLVANSLFLEVTLDSFSKDSDVNKFTSRRIFALFFRLEYESDYKVEYERLKKEKQLAEEV